MLKILSKSNVTKVKEKLTVVQLADLESKYLKGTECSDKEQQEWDRQELTFDSFLMQLVHETDYRARSGKDGNWEELESDYKFTDQDYEMILQAMKDCGWSTNMERW